MIVRDAEILSRRILDLREQIYNQELWKKRYLLKAMITKILYTSNLNGTEYNDIVDFLVKDV